MNETTVLDQGSATGPPWRRVVIAFGIVERQILSTHLACWAIAVKHLSFRFFAESPYRVQTDAEFFRQF